MNNGHIRVVVASPGKRARTERIPNTLAALQALVGGYLEAVHGPEGLRSKGFTIYCNDDGKRLGLVRNVPLQYDDFIAGTVVVSMADAGGEELGLDEKQAWVASAFLDLLRGLYEVPNKETGK